jgi:hypothetical protein
MSSQSQGNYCRKINATNNLTQAATMKYVPQTTSTMLPNKYILSKRVKVGRLKSE